MSENTMTLEQVRDFLRAEYDFRMAQRVVKDIAKTNDFLRASEAIDAHLSRPVSVSDEDVDLVRKEWERWAHSGWTLNRAWKEALKYYAAIEADRAGRGVVLSGTISADQAPSGSCLASSAEDAYAQGWNECLASKAQAISQVEPIRELSECRKFGWSDSAPAFRAGWNACREAMLAQGNGGVRDVPDSWYFADGPEGYFYSPSAEDANKLLSKTGFDRDDWTVTSLAASPQPDAEGGV